MIFSKKLTLSLIQYNSIKCSIFTILYKYDSSEIIWLGSNMRVAENWSSLNVAHKLSSITTNINFCGQGAQFVCQ